MTVKSPCIGTCVLDPKSGYCTGCYRTGDEIGAWMGLSDGNKKRIIGQARLRRARAKPPKQAKAPKKNALSVHS
jgi:predicted Fe-S protein YdhL (DUF1289 family)